MVQINAHDAGRTSSEALVAAARQRPVRAVVFDLDDTLAPSKSPMNPAMTRALADLLGQVEVGIISGGRYEQFQAQVLAALRGGQQDLERLHLMPTCGTRYYRWEPSGWALQYAEDLTSDDKARIVVALEESARSLGLWVDDSYGPVIEDRSSQVTYSALGQSAPLDAKAAWDPDGAKKRALRDLVSARLPDLEVRGGGSTSIDVTRQGIDKSYGMRKLATQTGLALEDFLFVGDRLDESGNDYPVLAMGVRCIGVEGWEQTLRLVTDAMAWWRNCLEGVPAGYDLLVGPQPG